MTSTENKQSESGGKMAALREKVKKLPLPKTRKGKIGAVAGVVAVVLVISLLGGGGGGMQTLYTPVQAENHTIEQTISGTIVTKTYNCLLYTSDAADE